MCVPPYVHLSTQDTLKLFCLPVFIFLKNPEFLFLSKADS